MKAMKKFMTIMSLALLATGFVSCSKEINADEPAPEKREINFRFIADASLTKVGLEPDEADANFTAKWDSGDRINIVCTNNGEPAPLEGISASWVASADSSTPGYFETKLDAKDLPSEGAPYSFVGYWPAEKSATELFPDSRTQYGDKYNGDYDIMISDKTAVDFGITESNPVTVVLPMKRQTSIAYFHITSELNENIVSATLTTDKPIASSNATLTYEGFEPNVETAGENSIKLIIDGKMSSSDFKLWFNVLPVQYETMSLLIETANHSFSLSKKSSGEWKAGELNKVVLTNVPAEKWAEIERPAGDKEVTLTMTSSNPTSYTSSDNVVTATFDANGGTGYTWYTDAVRLYAKGKVTVSVADGYKLKSVVFNAKVNANNSNKKPTPKINEVAVGEDDISWSGTASSIVLWADGTAGNIAISSIVVTYTDPNAPSDPIYKYSVVVNKDIANGTVSVDKTSAKEGDEVTITATPASGYELVAGSVKAYNAVSGAELTVTNNKFTMPAANVNVTAAFSQIPYIEATSPAAYASNRTDNSGNGYSIPVSSNIAWNASIKEGNNDADITLMNYEGEGDGNIVFKFNSANSDVLVDKTSIITLSPASGSRPNSVELSVTHTKCGATMYVNTDGSIDNANVLTASVEADATTFTFYVTKANFDWDVVSVKLNDVDAGDGFTAVRTITDASKHLGYVTVSFPVNIVSAETTEDRVISVKVGLDSQISGTNRTFNLTQKGTTDIDPSVDKITSTETGVKVTTYTGFTYISSTTGAEYSGNCSANSTTTPIIQIRSDYTNTKPASGLVVTKTAGVIQKVSVKWNNQSANGRVLNIYASNTAYDSVDDLFNSQKNSGTLIGTIVNGTSTELDLTTLANQYLYIGVRSNSGAIYLNEISIKYGDMPTASPLTSPSVSCTAKSKNSLTFSWSAIDHAEGYEVSTNGTDWIAANGALCHTITGLRAATQYGLYVKALGDGVFYDDSAASEIAYGTTSDNSITDLNVPLNLKWTAGTKILSWDDTNNGIGTYASDYKYQYRFGETGQWYDSTSETTAQLNVLTETTTVYVRAFAINTTLFANSAETANCSCDILVEGQSLPFSFNNNGTALGNLDYVTVNGVSDYNTSNAKIAFKTQGNYFIIKFKSDFNSYSMNSVQNGKTNGSVITVYGSVDGNSYTVIQAHTINQGNSKTQTLTKSNISGGYKFLKVELSTKKSNVGIGNISVSKK